MTIRFHKTRENEAARPGWPAVSLWLAVVMAAGAFGERADAQPSSGEQLYQQECAACHALEPGVNRIGPTLHDTIDREAGGLESFQNYSEALKQSDVVWTAETLDPWIEAPNEFIPDNRMAYAGLEDEEQRQQIIEFLQQQNGEEGEQ